MTVTSMTDPQGARALFACGQLVRVVQGPLRGVTGVIEAIEDAEHVLVRSLAYVGVRLVIGSSLLERIAGDNGHR